MDSKTSKLLKTTFKTVAITGFVIAALFMTGIIQVLVDTKI